MKFLMDNSLASLAKNGAYPHWLVGGQLLTPLTRYRRWHDVFAIDNGAFGGFKEPGFMSLLRREVHARHKCLFVCAPDVVGDHPATSALFAKYAYLAEEGWPLAFVAQNGCLPGDVPWEKIRCLFVGGKDPWKDGTEVRELVRVARKLGKHVHIGRVNTAKRFVHFMKMGAHTCDGSGVARYSKSMLPKIEAEVKLIYKEYGRGT